jgi:hypothetical protein
MSSYFYKIWAILYIKKLGLKLDFIHKLRSQKAFIGNVEYKGRVWGFILPIDNFKKHLLQFNHCVKKRT